MSLGQQHHVGEKPTLILYTYINCHAEPPNITKQKTLQYIVKRIVITYDNNGIEQYKKGVIFVVVLLVRLLRLERRKAQAKKKRSPKEKKAALWCPSVGRSGGPVFPAVNSAGGRFCCLHTITPPPSRSTANTAPHIICHHSDGVTSTMCCCCFKKRKRDPIQKQRVNHLSPVWACSLDPASEKRS